MATVLGTERYCKAHNHEITAYYPEPDNLHTLPSPRSIQREPRASLAFFRFTFTMSSSGGYGDVRARIDQDKLNAYLSTNVPAVTVPVTVKQFKVRQSLTLHKR